MGFIKKKKEGKKINNHTYDIKKWLKNCEFEPIKVVWEYFNNIKKVV